MTPLMYFVTDKTRRDGEIVTMGYGWSGAVWATDHDHALQVRLEWIDDDNEMKAGLYEVAGLDVDTIDFRGEVTDIELHDGQICDGTFRIKTYEVERVETPFVSREVVA